MTSSNASSLAVDSFTVVQYRATCAWACPYLVYAPLRRLRETTGHNTAANDLIFVSLDGNALPGDVVTAHVTVQEANGGYCEITASSAVQPLVSNPVLPAANGDGWACH